jgi:cell division protein FtsB
MKIKIAEKIILDRKHQHIIAALNQKIEKSEKELLEIKNIEIQHQKINGLLHEEVKKLKAEIKLLKEENRIIRKG